MPKKQDKLNAISVLKELIRTNLVLQIKTSALTVNLNTFAVKLG